VTLTYIASLIFIAYQPTDARDIAIGILSVCPSVCPSHSGIASRNGCTYYQKCFTSLYNVHHPSFLSRSSVTECQQKSCVLDQNVSLPTTLSDLQMSFYQRWFCLRS